MNFHHIIISELALTPSHFNYRITELKNKLGSGTKTTGTCIRNLTLSSQSTTIKLM